MSEQGKWQMNRIGLFNFWYYDDEIFELADGKLLLRGSNGSGKSVTMQSILPVLLDGRKSPDRLDPFGSKARKMEDYLLGEKAVVDRDERTGYLFIEYKRTDTNQYVTTGIGMQARRNKGIQSWYFAITDNRRIGIDLYLYETESHAGEKQQIPLSRIQLQNRIENGGEVVQTAKEYKQLVNNLIFGFNTMEAYDDLIKLLIQLRSPKLSKDFKPTVIYDILEAALPPLTDEDLRHLSDTIEHMDQTKQQIEQLQREQGALDKLIRRYDAYNTYQLTEKALEYISTDRNYRQSEKELQEKNRHEAELTEDIDTLEKRKETLIQTIDVQEQKQARLQKHDVWNLEEERQKENDRLQELKTDANKKDAQLTTKKQQELDAKARLETLENDIAASDGELDDLLEDMTSDAEEAAFQNHTVNQQDFLRHKDAAFDFTIWKQETAKHYERLEKIVEDLRKYEHLKQQVIDYQKRISEVHMEMDQTSQEEREWANVFETDKQEKMTAIHQWKEDHSFFHIDDALLQTVSRLMNALYVDESYEAIRAPFMQVNHDYQRSIHQAIAKEQNELEHLDEEMTEKESELSEWKAKRDLEPPFRTDDTREARKRLKENDVPFLPLYEAVEFKEFVPEEVKNRIEAALIDSGMLDALITSQDNDLVHDRIIIPKPNMMAHTLAEYVQPDVGLDSPISQILVDEVLSTILVDETSDEAAFAIDENGNYRLGILQGHASDVEDVRFIGKNARKRYREEQILQIENELDLLASKKEEANINITKLEQEITRAEEAMAQFPDDRDLREGFRYMEEKRFEFEQLKKEATRLDGELQQTNKTYQHVKRLLDEETRDLNIVFEYDAYASAKKMMHQYEMTLRNFENIHIHYSHLQTRKELETNHLHELIEEVDALKGEWNVLEGKIEHASQNLAEMEKQLAAQGVEEIRQQIQDVQDSLKESKEELDHHKEKTPEKKSEQNVLLKEIDQVEQKTRFYKNLSDAWMELFLREVGYGFITFPDNIETNDDKARWVKETYKADYDNKDSAKVSEQLTKMVVEQEPNLMEYRLEEKMNVMDTIDWMDDDFPDAERIQLNNWTEKGRRRLIQLDFQGQRVSPYYVRDMVERDLVRQQTFLDENDRQLYEQILSDSVGNKLRSRIARAQKWTEKMNKLMMESDSSSGLSFSIKWKPRTAETEAEMDTKELVSVLQRDARLLKEDDRNRFIEHFRSKIDRAKELMEDEKEGNTLLQVLKEVLDYRYWFTFVLSYKREGEPKRELTDHAFFQFSGGEKAMAMYIPLFTACYSRYMEASSAAPYIISLDEAFAGVDEDNISAMFRIVEKLGFDYIMNSQNLWGDYETVSALSICELIRPKNQDFVTVMRYVWDGRQRILMSDESLEDTLVKEHVEM